MKTIGFIDHYLSEWHANNYPAWIERLGAGEFTVAYAWAEEYVSPVDGRNTDQWCEAFGVTRCQTLSELCEKADYLLILAPSTPEKHLAYAAEALKYQKPTYIDKTFSPDYATAKEIFAIAQQYNTPIFTSSALRYATELDALVGADAVITTGGGRLMDEYLIHQVEMLVKLTDRAPQAVRVERQGEQYFCTVRMEGGKSGTMIFSTNFPFSVYTDHVTEIKSAFFDGLLADILRFYREGTPSFDPQQTLWVMKVREAVLRARDSLGAWLEI